MILNEFMCSNIMFFFLVWKNAVTKKMLMNQGLDLFAPEFVEVPKRLTALIRWFNSNRGKVHPIVFASYFHSEFENIHPFVDGNGRTGRLFLNFMLTKAGYLPIVIFFKHRSKYYEVLEKACEKKDLKPLIKILKKCYEEMIKIYGGETKY